jgi:hypothetical protein
MSGAFGALVVVLVYAISLCIKTNGIERRNRALEAALSATRKELNFLKFRVTEIAGAKPHTLAYDAPGNEWIRDHWYPVHQPGLVPPGFEGRVIYADPLESAGSRRYCEGIDTHWLYPADDRLDYYNP